jgi:hypothetical protein
VRPEVPGRRGYGRRHDEKLKVSPSKWSLAISSIGREKFM